MFVDVEAPDDYTCALEQALADRTGPGYVEPDPLDEIAREERAQTMALGHQMRAMAAHVRRVVDAAPSYFQEKAHRAAWAEIGLRLGLGPDTETRRIADATRLVEDLPATLDAMCAGSLPYAKAKVIVDETENITDREILRQVEAEALREAPALAAPRLRDKVRRIIERLDAEALRKRVEAAVRDRAVQLHRESDGMATLRAYLPVDQALSVFGVVDTLAHTTMGPDEPRSIDQLRADTLVDLICHPADQPSRVTYETQVLVPADLLLGRDGAEPARLADGSPIPDDLARAIAADSRWRLLLTDPGTRHLLDLGADTYKPSAGLTRFIQLRDRHCRWPGCGRPARRCQLDHTIKFRLGGSTIVANMGALCKRHHDVKDLPGWDAIQDPDTGAITLITPRGDRYTTRPPTVDGDESPVEVVLADAEPETPPF
jgi:hypothetical protein